MGESNGGKAPSHRSLSAALHQQLAARRAMADQVISLAHFLGRPVINTVGARVGRVSDVVVRWDAAVTHPPVTGVLVSAGRGLGFIGGPDVALSQTGVRLQSDRLVVSRAVRAEGDVALARDVLDRQLVDVAGVQVVRASDVYLVNGSQGLELAGIDIGLRALGRRLLPSGRRRCPRPDRVIDWADLHAFVTRFTDTSSPWESGPAVAAGTAGSGMQLDASAAQLKKLRANDVAAILADLPRHQQAQLTALASASAAAEALAQLDADHREALLAELDAPNRARLLALLEGDAR
jgi:MgtE intracellular N domain/PRC-barrel domain